jgi:hypothetical protein
MNLKEFLPVSIRSLSSSEIFKLHKSHKITYIKWIFSVITFYRSVQKLTGHFRVL